MLRDLIQRKRTDILRRWFALILETYPPDTAKMLKGEKDRFVNPVGATISKEIQVLFDQLSHEMNADKMSSALGNILQIRSVQDFSPSQAVSVVHLLKQAIRDGMGTELRGDEAFEEWLRLEADIDHLSLLAFDLYTKYRERMFEIRLRELKNQKEKAFELMARAGSKEEKRRS